MSEVDKDGWQKSGWLHINPDVKERLQRIEKQLDNVLIALTRLQSLPDKEYPRKLKKGK